MNRNRPIHAQPIGFLSGRAPNTPVQVPTAGPGPYPPYAGPNYLPNNFPILPHHGGMFPPGIPQAPQPSHPGLGGILQNLFGGKGSFDLPSIITNAQKVIGVVNQLGTAVRNMSPMIELLKGLSEPDPLDGIEKEKYPAKRRRVKRRPARRKVTRARRKRRKRRSVS